MRDADPQRISADQPRLLDAAVPQQQQLCALVVGQDGVHLPGDGWVDVEVRALQTGPSTAGRHGRRWAARCAAGAAQAPAAPAPAASPHPPTCAKVPTGCRSASGSSTAAASPPSAPLPSPASAGGSAAPAGTHSGARRRGPFYLGFRAPLISAADAAAATVRAQPQPETTAASMLIILPPPGLQASKPSHASSAGLTQQVVLARRCRRRCGAARLAALAQEGSDVQLSPVGQAQAGRVWVGMGGHVSAL